MNDDETIEYGLDTLCSITQNYVAVREPEPEDKLISSVYKMINSVTVVAIEKKSQQILDKIALTYGKMGIITTDIPSLRKFSHNLATGLAIFHLNELFNIISPFSNIHLQIIRSMQNIAVNSIQKQGDDALTIHFFSQMVANPKGVRNQFVFGEIVNAIVRSSQQP
jgi:hypothetical protein